VLTRISFRTNLQKEMAIFGKNGLQAAALYLGTLWAVYSTRNAGFKKGEEEKIVAIASRKNKTGARSSDKKQALQEIRAARYKSLIETKRPGSTRKYGKEYDKGGKFEKAYSELPYSR